MHLYIHTYIITASAENLSGIIVYLHIYNYIYIQIHMHTHTAYIYYYRIGRRYSSHDCVPIYL